MVILNLYGIPLHVVVVFRPEQDFFLNLPHHTVDWAVRAVLKISVILLKYPTF